METETETTSTKRYSSPALSRAGMDDQSWVTLEITNFTSVTGATAATVKLLIGGIVDTSEDVALAGMKESLLRVIGMIDEIKGKGKGKE